MRSERCLNTASTSPHKTPAPKRTADLTKSSSVFIKPTRPRSTRITSARAAITKSLQLSPFTPRSRFLPKDGLYKSSLKPYFLRDASASRSESPKKVILFYSLPKALGSSPFAIHIILTFISIPLSLLEARNTVPSAMRIAFPAGTGLP